MDACPETHMPLAATEEIELVRHGKTIWVPVCRTQQELDYLALAQGNPRNLQILQNEPREDMKRRVETKQFVGGFHARHGIIETVGAAMTALEQGLEAVADAVDRRFVTCDEEQDRRRDKFVGCQFLTTFFSFDEPGDQVIARIPARSWSAPPRSSVGSLITCWLLRS